MKKQILVCGTAAALSACASTPDVTYGYYAASVLTTATVTQSVACNSDNSALVVVNTPSTSTAYTADYSKQYFFPIKNVASMFADSDANFTFSEDGRLKSINQSTTGQGQTILNGAIAAATGVAALGGSAPAIVNKAAKPKALSECTFLSSYSAGKPVTLTYNATFDPGSVAASMSVPFDAGPDQGLYDVLKAHLPPLAVHIYKPQPIPSVVSATTATLDDGSSVPLELRNMQTVRFDIEASGQGLSTSYVVAPAPGTYKLPIPKAALFGTEKFSLTLSDAGAVTAVDYGTNTGAAAALSVVSTAAAAAKPESAADKAADVKGQADLIVQQNRLAMCKAQPAKCQ